MSVESEQVNGSPWRADRRCEPHRRDPPHDQGDRPPRPGGPRRPGRGRRTHRASGSSITCSRRSPGTRCWTSPSKPRATSTWTATTPSRTPASPSAMAHRAGAGRSRRHPALRRRAGSAGRGAGPRGGGRVGPALSVVRHRHPQVADARRLRRVPHAGVLPRAGAQRGTHGPHGPDPRRQSAPHRRGGVQGVRAGARRRHAHRSRGSSACRRPRAPCDRRGGLRREQPEERRARPGRRRPRGDAHHRSRRGPARRSRARCRASGTSARPHARSTATGLGAAVREAAARGPGGHGHLPRASSSSSRPAPRRPRRAGSASCPARCVRFDDLAPGAARGLGPGGAHRRPAAGTRCSRGVFRGAAAVLLSRAQLPSRRPCPTTPCWPPAHTSACSRRIVGHGQRDRRAVPSGEVAAGRIELLDAFARWRP